MHRALGGVWTVALLAAPEMPLTAHVWAPREESTPEGDLVHFTATWHVPGAEHPWHTELHVTHRIPRDPSDEATRTGEALYSLILALAGTLEG